MSLLFLFGNQVIDIAADSLIFVSCDVISLVVQGAGGGIAASGDTLEDANMGGNIMLGGIVFQLGLSKLIHAASLS